MINGGRRWGLDGEWELYFCCDDEWSQRYSALPYTAASLAGSGMPHICAVVPGSFELDMERAGMMEDPFFADNMLKMQPFEYMHFIYVREFQWSDEIFGGETLLFEGIDTFADVYLNGEKIGRADNMLIPWQMPASVLKSGENELVVHIRPAVLEARKYEYTSLNLALKYNYDSLYVRKAASMYGWDIMPRMVSAGIWRSVSLVRRAPVHIEQAYLYTVAANEQEASLALFFELELQREPAYEYSLALTLSCGDQKAVFDTKVWGKCGKEHIRIAAPKLWWPRGYGEQPLYDVLVELKKNGKTVDAYAFRTGIRVVKLHRSSVVDENGKGEFCFEVNGRRVFILGTNWVPPDALPSRGDKRASEILRLVEDIGCNAIRIWGGGRYEQESFYEECDRRGILIWHDFMMGCGNYPQTGEFIARLSEEVRSVVRQLRHHPSICLWAGDNECDMNYWNQVNFTDPNLNILTRQVIPGILLNEDFTRPYLPSSPYIDEECYRCGLDNGTENHLWGERIYYKAPFYRDAKALFASEIGYHGCPSPLSVYRFISSDNVWPPDNNREWLLHASSPDPLETEPYGYRIQLMKKQIAVLFGEVSDSLEMFSLASQISQAEAMKFFIERFRSQKWERTGIIWWNICDGWPQFSDAVVDYYFTKKLAYYFIRRSQQPLCMMVDEAENGVHRLIVVNDTDEDCQLQYRITSMRSGNVLAQGEVRATADAAVQAATLKASHGQDFLLIEWTDKDKSISGRNGYLMGEPPYELADYMDWANRAGMLELEGFSSPVSASGTKISGTVAAGVLP